MTRRGFLNVQIAIMLSGCVHGQPSKAADHHTDGIVAFQGSRSPREVGVKSLADDRSNRSAFCRGPLAALLVCLLIEIDLDSTDATEYTPFTS